MTHKTYLILVLCFIISVVSENRNFGKFNFSVNKMETCKGPKKKDCAKIEMTLKSRDVILYDIMVMENMSPNKGKVVTISSNNETLRLQINKPCEHLFTRPLMDHLFNMTRCVIKKGHYPISLNIADIFRNYFGGTHLFGTWTFKSQFFNDYCNFICTIVEVSFTEYPE